MELLLNFDQKAASMPEHRAARLGNKTEQKSAHGVDFYAAFLNAELPRNASQEARFSSALFGKSVTEETTLLQERPQTLTPQIAICVCEEPTWSMNKGGSVEFPSFQDKDLRFVDAPDELMGQLKGRIGASMQSDHVMSPASIAPSEQEQWFVEVARPVQTNILYSLNPKNSLAIRAIDTDLSSKAPHKLGQVLSRNLPNLPVVPSEQLAKGHPRTTQEAAISSEIANRSTKGNLDYAPQQEPLIKQESMALPVAKAAQKSLMERPQSFTKPALGALSAGDVEGNDRRARATPKLQTSEKGEGNVRGSREEKPGMHVLTNDLKGHSIGKPTIQTERSKPPTYPHSLEVDALLDKDVVRRPVRAPTELASRNSMHSNPDTTVSKRDVPNDVTQSTDREFIFTNPRKRLAPDKPLTESLNIAQIHARPRKIVVTTPYQYVPHAMLEARGEKREQGAQETPKADLKSQDVSRLMVRADEMARPGLNARGLIDKVAQTAPQSIAPQNHENSASRLDRYVSSTRMPEPQTRQISPTPNLKGHTMHVAPNPISEGFTLAQQAPWVNAFAVHVQKMHTSLGAEAGLGAPEMGAAAIPEAATERGTPRSTPQHNMPPMRDISAQLVEKMSIGQDRQIEIWLHPKSLGRVYLMMQPLENGMMQMQIVADHAETMEYLRRHADVLQEEFGAAGYRNFNFSFGAQGHDQRRPAHETLRAEQEEKLVPKTLPLATVDRHQAASSTRKMDIRI